MKNKSGDGIFCDYCGEEFRENFVYYSFDFRRIFINQHGFSNIDDDVAHTADLCESCMGLFKQRLLDVSSKINLAHKCDVSGAVLPKKSFDYFICYVSEVKVDLSNQLYMCSECNKPRQPSEGLCEKGTCKLFREANVSIDKEYLELNFTPETFDKFKEHINYIQGIGAPTWAT